MIIIQRATFYRMFLALHRLDYAVSKGFNYIQLAESITHTAAESTLSILAQSISAFLSMCVCVFWARKKSYRCVATENRKQKSWQMKINA